MHYFSQNGHAFSGKLRISRLLQSKCSQVTLLHRRPNSRKNITKDLYLAGNHNKKRNYYLILERLANPGPDLGTRLFSSLYRHNAQ